MCLNVQVLYKFDSDSYMHRKKNPIHSNQNNFLLKKDKEMFVCTQICKHLFLNTFVHKLKTNKS